MSTPAASPSLKERQRQEREQLILRAAGELMLEKGYHETSIDDIAARVGISKGTVYLHFGSKEDLAFALYVKGMRSLLQDLDTMAASPVSPRRKLRAIIGRIHGGMSSQHAQLLTTLFRSPEFQARFMEKRQELEALREGPRKRITAIVEEGKAAGQIDLELPTPLVVSLVWGMLSPHTYRGLIVEKRPGSNLVVAHLCRFFLKGIAPGDVPPDDPPDTLSDSLAADAIYPETEPPVRDDEESSALTANGVTRP
jgi:TetR/AcrR family transcriptional regulator, fatty acid metabolism regulator protein